MTITALVARRAGSGQRRRRDVGPRPGRRRAGVRDPLPDVGGVARCWASSRCGGYGSRRTSCPFAGEGEDPRYAGCSAAVASRSLSARCSWSRVRRSGWCPCRSRPPAVTDVEWAWVCALGVAVWAVGAALRDRRRPAAGDVPRPSPRPAAAGARHRALGLFPAPELLRRRLCLVGIWLAGAVSAGWLPALVTVVAPVDDDPLPPQRHRREADGAHHVDPPGLGRVRRPGAVVRAPPASGRQASRLTSQPPEQPPERPPLGVVQRAEQRVQLGEVDRRSAGRRTPARRR